MTWFVGLGIPEISLLCIEAIVVFHVRSVVAVSVNLAIIISTADGITGSADTNVV